MLFNNWFWTAAATFDTGIDDWLAAKNWWYKGYKEAAIELTVDEDCWLVGVDAWNGIFVELEEVNANDWGFWDDWFEDGFANKRDVDAYWLTLVLFGLFVVVEQSFDIENEDELDEEDEDDEEEDDENDEADVDGVGKLIVFEYIELICIILELEVVSFDDGDKNLDIVWGVEVTWSDFPLLFCAPGADAW